MSNENIEDDSAATGEYYGSKHDYNGENVEVGNLAHEYYESNKDYYESNQDYNNDDVYDDNNAAMEYYESNEQGGGNNEYGEFSEYSEDSNRNIPKEIIDHEQFVTKIDDESNQEIVEKTSENYEFVEDDNRDVEHDSNEGSYKDVEDENVVDSQSCESTEFSNKELVDENTDSCNVEEKESQDSDYLDAMSNEPSAQNTPVHKESDLKVVVSFEQDNEILQVIREQDCKLESADHDSQSENQVILPDVQKEENHESLSQTSDSKVENEIILSSTQEDDNYQALSQTDENLAEKETVQLDVQKNESCESIPKTDEIFEDQVILTSIQESQNYQSFSQTNEDLAEKEIVLLDIQKSESYESLPKIDEIVEDEVVSLKVQESENFESLSPNVEKMEEIQDILPNVQESENYESLSPTVEKMEEIQDVLLNVQESENFESLSPIHDKTEKQNSEALDESTSPLDVTEQFNELVLIKDTEHETSADEQSKEDKVQASEDLAQVEDSTLHNVECSQQDDYEEKNYVPEQRSEEPPQILDVLESNEVQSESSNSDTLNETKKITSSVILNNTCDDSGFVDDQNDSFKIKGKFDAPQTILESETKEETLENCDIAPEPVNESNPSESAAESKGK